MSETSNSANTIAERAGSVGAEAVRAGNEEQAAPLRVRRATIDDIDALIALALDSAQEHGALKSFDKEHARAHMEDILRRGIIYAAVVGDDLIGAAMLTPIDTSFCFLEDLESQHLFLRADRRGYHVVSAILRRVKSHARDHGISILMHQVAYHAALAGDKRQTQRVERLYKRFGFDGSYGITYVCRPGQES